MRRSCVAVAFLAAALIVVLPVGEAMAESPPVKIDQGAFVARVLALTNAERDNAGLASLTLSPQLQVSAQTYAQVLAGGNCFEHTCGPVPDFADRDAQAGYVDWMSIGENIAGGYTTPEAVMAGWMNSPGHRANILSATFTEIGIGVTSGGGRFGVYWAQEFGTRDDAVSAADGG